MSAFSLKFWDDFLHSYGNQICLKNISFWAPTYLIWRRIDGVVEDMIFGGLNTFGCISLEQLQVCMWFILWLEAIPIHFLLTLGSTELQWHLWWYLSAKKDLQCWSWSSQVCLNIEVLFTLVLVCSANIEVLTAYNMGLFGVSTSHELSQVTGLVWSTLFANLIEKVVLYQHYSVIVSLWHYTITQAIFNIPILCCQKIFNCIMAKYIWGMPVVRVSGIGWHCGKLPNMVSQKKYSTQTEMIYPSKNGMAVTNSQTEGKPSSSCTQALTKIYPFKYSMFCCRPELQTSNFWVMKPDEVARNGQNSS